MRGQGEPRSDFIPPLPPNVIAGGAGVVNKIRGVWDRDHAHFYSSS